MNKVLLIVGLTLITTGCGNFSRWWAGVAGHDSSCIDGVVYLQFKSGTSVAYNPDGSIKTCK